MLVHNELGLLVGSFTSQIGVVFHFLFLIPFETCYDFMKLLVEEFAY